MAAALRRFRMSIVQTATMLELLRHEPAPPVARLRQVARSTGYQQLFRQVGPEGRVNEGLGVSVPWNLPPDEQPFWSYYLKHPSLRGVTENVAWNSAVPLRKGLADRLLTDVEPGALASAAKTVRDSVVAYYYPHGLGLVVDIDVTGEFDTEALVDAARGLHGTDPLADGKLLPTNAFLREQLRDLAAQLLGGPLGGDSLGPRCTVVTVILGDAVAGIDADLRKALLGLADWREHWRHHVVADDEWARAVVRMEGEPPAHVVVGAGRGRAVWYPLDFVAPADAAAKRTKLRELHTELTLGSLQVESLAQLVRHSLPDQQWTSLQENRVRTALAMLRALFHRVRDLPSHSPRRHILDNGYADELNQAEARLGRYPPSFAVP